MKKITLLLLICLISGLVYSQEKNKIIFDTICGKDILIGSCDRDGLKSEVFGEYFLEEYSSYKPKSSVLKKIKPKLRNIEIVCVLGTWCGDSKEQLGRFYKILDKMNFNENNLKLICVDRSKSTREVEINKFEIERVPTFIFFKDGNEIGRIIETPKTTLEKDMLKILEL
ncbi:MAG: thioredoxin family protein [Bacteroidales bacterium]|nr:thioredoxin family protein [Bacteroidales bacterium]